MVKGSRSLRPGFTSASLDLLIMKTMGEVGLLYARATLES